MTEMILGYYDEKVRLPEQEVPPKGERVAAWVDDYLSIHKGLTVGELAHRIRADKRDLQRLLRDRSCGHRLEDRLAAYFGPVFVKEVFEPLWAEDRTRRADLERELAEMNAAEAQLARARSWDRP